MEKSIIYCLDTLGGTQFGPKMKSVYCDVSSIKWPQKFGRAYANTFQLIFLLFLLTFEHSLSFCDLCNVIFNIFKCFVLLYSVLYQYMGI